MENIHSECDKDILVYDENHLEPLQALGARDPNLESTLGSERSLT